MPLASLGDLLEALRAHGLLNSTQLAEADRFSATVTDPKSLARELMRRGWLTAYQTNQIMQGRAADLALGPYVLLERIGEGGMGAVFKARHQKLNRVVALKLIRREKLSHPDAVKRFHREI